jgi:hypothetical protein
VLKYELQNCTDLIHFPEMRYLKTLTLRACDSLVSLPSLPSLKFLCIDSCHMMKTVPYSPILVYAMITSCSDFEDLSTFSHCQDVSVGYCRKVTSVLPLQ